VACRGCGGIHNTQYFLGSVELSYVAIWQVAAVNIQAGRINRSRFSKGVNCTHMTADVRCTSAWHDVCSPKFGEGAPPNGFVIFHHPTSHTSPRAGERGERVIGNDC
jgi:hypothetical protein